MGVDEGEARLYFGFSSKISTLKLQGGAQHLGHTGCTDGAP